MKKRNLTAFLYSTVGVVAILLLLIAFNLIAAQVKLRIDLTAEKAYTLSPGTRAILAKLDTPVQIRFYCTKNTNAIPVALANYAQRVEDLLGEYKQASKGLVAIQRLNPEPDTDAEDSARLDGIEGRTLRNGETIYLGLNVAMLDQKQALPFLTPDRERLLEYDISRAIAHVMATEKPIIGIMSSLPVMGSAKGTTTPEGTRTWAFVEELERDFKVKPVEITTDTIPDYVRVLVVIHPKTISETTQFALDQFVLRGGKLIVFVDPVCALDRPSDETISPASNSTLDKLFPAWGLTFDKTKVVADMERMARLQEGSNPGILMLNENALNKDDVLTARTDNLVMAFSGVFTGSPTAGITETILIRSSTQSQLIDAAAAPVSGNEIASNFVASGVEYPLAIKLTGKFKTAFPDGKPAPTNSNGQKSPEKTGSTLKESAQPATVILIGDVDIIQDPLTVREVQAKNGQRLIVPINGNLNFAQSAVEQLAGDDNLIAVRSRASRERPFTVVQKMQAAAEANYRSKIRELETSLTETQRKVNELQRNKGDGQQFILSPAQQQELVNFRTTEAEVKLQLKKMRKKLRAEIDSLENRIKWLNIAAIPVAIILAGFGLSTVKQNRAAS